MYLPAIRGLEEWVIILLQFHRLETFFFVFPVLQRLTTGSHLSHNAFLLNADLSGGVSPAKS